MTRDGLSEEAAESLIQDAKKQLEEYLESGDMNSADDICAEFFGLEPDYLMELIPI